MYIQGDFLAPANYATQESLSPQEVSPPHFFVILNSAQVGLALGGPEGGGVAVLPEQPPDAGMMLPPGLNALPSKASSSLGPAGGEDGGGPPDGGGWKGVLAEFNLRSCAPICIYTHLYLYK